MSTLQTRYLVKPILKDLGGLHDLTTFAKAATYSEKVMPFSELGPKKATLSPKGAVPFTFKYLKSLINHKKSHEKVSKSDTFTPHLVYYSF
jgi:hypothetical protein